MAPRLTRQQIRKQARQRAVEAAAKHENIARERFEAELAEQRARAKANEDDLGSYFAAEAAIADAEEHLATTKKTSCHAMSEAAEAIATREGSVRAAAALLGVTPSRLNSLARTVNGHRSSVDEPATGERHPTSRVEDGSSDAAGGAPAAEAGRVTMLAESPV